MSQAVTHLDVVYGNSITGRLSFSGSIQRAGASASMQSLESVASEVQQALSSPIDFPPIEQAIVPGDRVVLAIDSTIPRLADVTSAVIDYLCQRGVERQQISVVLAAHASFDTSALAQRLTQQVHVEVHDADDQTKVAYVAANKEGEPIYMNRTMVDADVVIPIMCARGREAIDYEGAYGVFPHLTDRRTRGQFYSLRHLANPSEHQRLTNWADEAAWWVGLLVAVQVVPAPAGGVARVMAGNPQALEHEVQACMTQLWHTDLHQAFECVIALIDGDESQQSWDTIARVVASASPLVAIDGALIICSDLNERPGRALHKLSSPHRSEEKLAQQLSSDSADDALAAAVLLESLESCHVYLLSQLPGSVVEPLGVGAIENLHQAEHILQQRKNCLVISSAQHSIVRRVS